MIDVLATLTYANIIMHKTIHIALTLADLNLLDVMAADIMNAYITDPCMEKIGTVLGSELGKVKGKKVIIARALYSLKTTSEAFSEHLADCMHSLGYKSCHADPHQRYTAPSQKRTMAVSNRNVHTC